MNPANLLKLAKMRNLGGTVLRDEPLLRHTSFRIGGPADLYVTVQKESDLTGWMALAGEERAPVFLIGRGTNLLMSDRGIRGLVIENRCRGVRYRGEHIVAQGGASLAALALRSAKASLSGLEWAAGIPGTVGGAIAINAGAYGSSIVEVLRHVSVLNSRDSRQTLPASELELDYRNSRLRRTKETILWAELALRPAPRDIILERIASYQKHRRGTQPKEPSAGSIFKNPRGDFAGRLIEASGLKGKRIGNAQISPLHANFIVNVGGAKAVEVVSLIRMIREKIVQKEGIRLELEIELAGDWGPEELAGLRT